jgi:hypothetical protein
VPSVLVLQWIEAANAVKNAYEAEFGWSFEIITNTTVATRKTKSSESVVKNLKYIHSLRKAAFWIVSAAEARKALNDSHLYVVPFRIYDELSENTEGRYSSPNPPTILKTIVCSATPESFSTKTERQPNHPVRMVFNGNYKKSQHDHVAKLRLIATASWLHSLVYMSLGHLMPKAIQVVRLKRRGVSLSGMHCNNDLELKCLDDLLMAVIRGAACSATIPAAAVDKQLEVLHEIKHIFEDGDGDDAKASESSLVTRLNAQRQIMEAKVKQMDTFIARPGEVSSEYRTAISTKRRSYINIVRFFSTILGALETGVEDPVTMETIEENDMVILPCCTSIFARSTIKKLPFNRCPLCKQSLGGGLLSASSSIGILRGSNDSDNDGDGDDSAGKKRSYEDAFHNEDEDDEDEDQLNQTMRKRLNQLDLTTGVQSCVEVVNELINTHVKKQHVKMKMTNRSAASASSSYEESYTGFRVLFCYYKSSIYQSQGDVITTNKLFEQLLLKTKLHSASEISHLKQSQKLVAEYKDVDSQNRALIINLSEHSNSLEGLDLQNTNAVVLDQVYSTSSSSTVAQALGRAIRPSLDTNGEDKTLVILTR